MLVAPNTRVFVAQLDGLPVFGPSGESIGKVRDIVVALRLDRKPPRALGLVVELPTRRPIFVPMLRVSSLESHAVALATGSVSMRRTCVSSTAGSLIMIPRRAASETEPIIATGIPMINGQGVATTSTARSGDGSPCCHS